MPSEKRSSSAGSARSIHTSGSGIERGSGSMGYGDGEAGRRIAAEDEYIRRELAETNAFCNGFWGVNDAGYDVIQGRIKASQRALDDLRSLYKERAEIEAEYAKRLAKLSRSSLGREDTGALRAALDVVKSELDATSRTHSDLANMVKKDLEGTVVDFQSKAAQTRKASQANIEKLYKNKQTQEHYVNKAREKYEQDCIKINGYTAQSSLVQGKDLDKVAYKLDKAQATVAQNEKDYQNFVRALKDTTFKWNAEWKAYLDQCQDLEEERIDFMKSNLWNYANAISAVCVADDESCERVRVSLESVDTPRDIQLFIQYCGTGSLIPAAPEYINYAKGQPPPPRPNFQTAKFQRNTTRPIQLPISQPPPPPPQQQQQQQLPPQTQTQQPQQQSSSQEIQDEYSHPVTKSSPAMTEQPIIMSNVSSSSSQPPATYRGPTPVVEPNGRENPNAGSTNIRLPPGSVALPGMTSAPSAQVPTSAMYQEEQKAVPAQEKRMSARSFLARTSSMSRPSKVQTPKPLQAHVPSSVIDSPRLAGPKDLPASPDKLSLAPSQSLGSNVGEEDDPIAKALASLRMRPGGRSPGPQSPGPTARYDAGSRENVHQTPTQTYGGAYQQPGQAVPYRAPSPSMPQGFPDRARSPSAAFMQAPLRASSPMPVEDVVGQYGQSFPGERKAVSRQNSTSSRMSVRPSQGMGAGQPKSPVKGNESGFAGVGAGGRSRSPQPWTGNQRPASHDTSHAADHARRKSQVPPRSPTPLGISLDATGSVTHDQMAEEYRQRSGSVPPVQAAVTAAPNRPSSVAPGGYQPSVHHQSQPSLVSHYNPSQTTSLQSPYSYQGSMSQQPYQTQHAAQPSPSQATQPSMYSQPPPGQPQQVGPDGRPFGTYPTTIFAQAPQTQQPPASQSLPAHLAQQPPQHASSIHSGISSAGHPQYQQQPPPSTYFPQQQIHPTQETPASSYMHDYQQQHSLANGAPVGVGGHAQPPSTVSMHQHPTSLHLQQPPQWGASGAQPLRSTSPAPIQQQQQQPQQPQSHPTPQLPGQQPGQPQPPTGQFSDSGMPILFYVKALYDYHATTAEEFSFTAGDIIAVTHTEPDGWWQGELLDEARRRQGSNTFPSNFVVLLM